MKFGALLIAALALASAALAGLPGLPTRSQTGFVPLSQYITPEGVTTVDLYVQPDGGVDAPSCTITSPCRTLQYTWDNMVPATIRGGTTLTINLADGTYDETNLKLGGKTLIQSNNATSTLNIQGSSTMAQAVGLTTGTTSVTSTAYTAASGFTPASVTDSSGVWTTNNLKGKFLTSTSGATAGQRRIIFSNTGTVLTLVAGFTSSPVNGTTFTIDSPGAVFTKSASIIGVQGPGISTGMNLSRMAFRPTSGSALDIQMSSGFKTMTDVIVDATTGSNALIFRGNQTANTSTIQFSNVVALGGSGTGLSITFSFGSTYGSTLGTGVYVRATTTAVSLLSAGWFGGIVTETTGTGINIGLQGSSSFQTSSLPSLTRHVCTGGVGTGWHLAQPSSSALGFSYATGTIGSTSFEGCTTAVSVLGRNHVDVRGGTVNISNATNGYVASKGGLILLGSGAGITYATVTNETTTDGVVLTQAAIDALVPPRQCATDATCISRQP